MPTPFGTSFPACLMLLAPITLLADPARVVEGSDPVCSKVQDAVISEPMAFAYPGDQDDQPKWSGVEFPRPMHSTQESDFDFYNDGKLARVFLTEYDDHYMAGSTLLVQSGNSVTKVDVAISNPLEDPNAWYIPCQFESTNIAVADCPPFSGNNNEAGLSASYSKRSKAIRFRGRYSYVLPWRINSTTYVIVTANSAGSAGYIAVLKPLSGRRFKLSCLMEAGLAGLTSPMRN